MPNIKAKHNVSCSLLCPNDASLGGKAGLARVKMVETYRVVSATAHFFSGFNALYVLNMRS